MRQSRAAVAATAVRPCGVAIALSLATVALAGTFVPLQRDSGIEHVFIWPGPFVSVISSIAAAGLIFVISARSGGRVPSLTPLAWLGVLALGILPAVPGVGRRGTVVAYFLYELRWWWIAAAALAVAARLRGFTGCSPPPWTHRAAAPALVVLLSGWAILTMPFLAFDSALHGDEPKYLRYCETWYQGNGFRIDHNQPVDDWTSARGSAVLGNVAHAGRALLEEVPTLAADLRQWVSHPLTFHWNRAVGLRLDDGRAAYFVTGKRGGVYQSHMPGVSFLLMPGYYLDRQFLSHEPGYERQVPKRLAMTNVTMLVLYAWCGVALLALLRRALEHEAAAFMASATAMMTLPATSFAFQLYPEIPAALIVIVATDFILLRATAARKRALIAMGVLAGSLPWLHPRFLLVSLVFVVAAGVALRGCRLAAYVAGWTFALLTAGAYAYRITGSWMPTALFDVYGETGSFLLRDVPLHAVGNAFDRFYGVLPHSPLLVLALPGLAVLARQHARSAAVVATAGAALWIAAAGHGLGAAGGTPGRHVLAVLPLMIWPVAVLVRTFHRSSALLTVAAILAVLSIDAAYSYNRHHIKPEGRMIDGDVSGWKPNLAFPYVSTWPEDGPQQIQLGALALGIVGATVWAFVASGRQGGERTRRGTFDPRAAALVIAASHGLTSITGYWYRGDYAMEYSAARLEAAQAIVSLRRCRVCFSSESRAFSPTRLAPVDVRELTLESVVGGGGDTTFTLRLGGATGDPVFGRALVDFGDGELSGWFGVVGQTTVEHRYGRSGTFTSIARLNAPGQPQLIARSVVEITK